MLIYILITFIVFIFAVIFIFRLVFRRDLDTAVTSLKELQVDTLAKESELKETLERAKTERDAQIEEGKKMARQMIEDAKEKSQKMHTRIIEKAERERDDILEGGREEFKKLKRGFEKEVKDEAAKFAVEAIRHVFAEERKEFLHRHIIAEFLQELRGIDKTKFTANGNEGIYTSALPLTSEEAGDLESILTEKTGRTIKWEAKVDRSLVIGIMIQIGDFVVDGSLKDKLEKAMLQLKRGDSQ